MSNLPARYSSIPHCATQIRDSDVRSRPKLITSIPTPFVPGESTSNQQPSSPTRQSLNISNLLLSSNFHFPSPPPSSPRDGARLLSTREPLSLQATTVNFRRFVSKSGPIFWFQDRIEEVIMWRNGWKVTCTWMSIYVFLCFFPRLFLLLPHVILIAILLAKHGVSEKTDSVIIAQIASSQQPKEGSVDWYANLQAIQNLMGAVSDLHDAALPFVPILTWNTPYTPKLLTAACLSLLILIPVAIVLPLRPALLFMGLVPLLITHPISLQILPALLRPLTRTLRSRVQNIVDDDNLDKHHWYSERREVELWESERWTLNGGWSKSTLKLDEHKPWSKGNDDWWGIVSDVTGDIRGLTFALSPEYAFIETEDWRLDLEGKWGQGTDNYGWVYTNDCWQHPCPVPLEEWKANGMTRRRRWVRRVYVLQD